MATQKVSYVRRLPTCGSCGLPQLPSEEEQENQESSESRGPSTSLSTPSPKPTRAARENTPVRKSNGGDRIRDNREPRGSKAGTGKKINEGYGDKEAPKKVDKGKKPAKKQPLDSSGENSSPLIPKRPEPSKQPPKRSETKAKPKSKPKPEPKPHAHKPKKD